MNAAHTDSPERVLSTLNKDGTRRWLFPRVSPGRFLNRRRVVAYALLVIYNVLPWIKINGKPTVLIDLPHREFTFFGTTFLSTDTLLFMLFMAGVFVTIFLLTALFGRVWCGWGCPQTVYMEFVYRPIERLFDGSPDARRRGEPAPSGIRSILKYAVFFLVSLHLAHTFLAYFVGAENLFDWTKHSPFQHPTAFLIVAATTGLMMFDFCFFREQVCIVACPYGRFQSVMLDKNSLIVGYDEKRGEPRGKKRKQANGDIALPQLGDCIDCKMCVTTCPTGIDIRDGLQMECVGCAQCIDACDSVMEKIGRPKGLIRYSSQAAIETGKRSLIRPRVIIYPAILLIVATAFITVLTTRQPVDVTLLRDGAAPYATLDTGDIANALRVKIVNRSEERRTFAIGVEGIDGASTAGENNVQLEPGETRVANVDVIAPRKAFELGRASIYVAITDDAGFATSMHFRLQGPWNAGAGQENEQ